MSHVSTKSAARYLAGDLGDRRSAAIRRHLSGCARCSRLDAELRSVPGLLASVPAPPLPAPVEARLSAALAAESARRAAATTAALGAGSLPDEAMAGGPVPVPGRPDLPERAPRSSRAPRAPRRARFPRLAGPLALRLAAAAGALAVIAGGGYGLLQALLQQPQAITSGAPAVGSGANARQVVPAGVPVALQYERYGRRVAVTAVATTTRYQPGTLAAQVRRALPTATASSEKKGPVLNSPLSGAANSPAGGLRIGGFSVAALEGCISRVAAGRRVLLVNVAYYGGSPATVIATSAGGGSVSIWVVGTSCSAAQSDVLAHTTARG